MDYLYANIDADIIDSGEIKFTTVSAEVDNNSGTPSVDVSLRDDTDLHFFFHNLKGDQGVAGPQGPTGEQGQQGVPGMGLDNTGRLDWSLLKNVPTEFKPEPHSQTMATIETGFFHELDPFIEDEYLPDTLTILNDKIDAKPNASDYYTITEVDGLLSDKSDRSDILRIDDDLAVIRSTKQDKLIAGTNIELEITENGTIINSLTDPSVSDRLTSLEEYSEELGETKQDNLTAENAGNNITITNEGGLIISASTDPEIQLTIETLESSLSNLTNRVTALDDPKTGLVTYVHTVAIEDLENNVDTLDERMTDLEYSTENKLQQFRLDLNTIAGAQIKTISLEVNGQKESFVTGLNKEADLGQLLRPSSNEFVSIQNDIISLKRDKVNKETVDSNRNLNISLSALDYWGVNEAGHSSSETGLGQLIPYIKLNDGVEREEPDLILHASEGDVLKIRYRATYIDRTHADFMPKEIRFIEDGALIGKLIVNEPTDASPASGYTDTFNYTVARSVNITSMYGGPGDPGEGIPYPRIDVNIVTNDQANRWKVLSDNNFNDAEKEAVDQLDYTFSTKQDNLTSENAGQNIVISEEEGLVKISSYTDPETAELISDTIQHLEGVDDRLSFVEEHKENRAFVEGYLVEIIMESLHNLFTLYQYTEFPPLADDFMFVKFDNQINIGDGIIVKPLDLVRGKKYITTVLPDTLIDFITKWVYADGDMEIIEDGYTYPEFIKVFENGNLREIWPLAEFLYRHSKNEEVSIFNYTPTSDTRIRYTLTYKNPSAEGEVLTPEELKEKIESGEIPEISADDILVDSLAIYIEKLDSGEARRKVLSDNNFTDEYKLVTDSFLITDSDDPGELKRFAGVLDTRISSNIKDRSTDIPTIGAIKSYIDSAVDELNQKIDAVDDRIAEIEVRLRGV